MSIRDAETRSQLLRAPQPISNQRPAHPVTMAVASIQDRTNEFKLILNQVQKRQTSSKVGAQRQSLLTDSQKAAANKGVNGDAKPRRSEFARNAAEIGRGIAATMGKLEKLAQRKEPAIVTLYNL